MFQVVESEIGSVQSLNLLCVLFVPADFDGDCIVQEEVAFDCSAGVRLS